MRSECVFGSFSIVFVNKKRSKFGQFKLEDLSEKQFLFNIDTFASLIRRWPTVVLRRMETSFSHRMYVVGTEKSYADFGGGHFHIHKLEQH